MGLKIKIVMLLKLNIHFLMFRKLLIKVFFFKVKYNIAGVMKEIKKILYIQKSTLFGKYNLKIK